MTDSLVQAYVDTPEGKAMLARLREWGLLARRPKPYRVVYQGEFDDAYVEGNLARAVKDSEIEWVRVFPREGGGFQAFGGYSGSPPLTEDALAANIASDYWGNGRTEEEALRFLHGAALDPREKR